MPTVNSMMEDGIEIIGMFEAEIMIHVQTAGGRQCDISADEWWICHDLHKVVQEKLDVPVKQQRLLYHTAVLEDFMARRGFQTLGQLHRSEGTCETPLVFFLYIRSTEVVEALEAVKQNGRALGSASEELRGDREVVMEAVKQNGTALAYASKELKGDRPLTITLELVILSIIITS